MPGAAIGQLQRAVSAKLAAPDAGWLIARPRLFDRLDQAGCGTVTIVVAPGGSGKTSLVASWVHSRLLGSAAWYTLDEADRDSRHCLEGICAAIEGVQPGACSAPLAALAAGERDLAVAATLAQALEEHPVTLVLDDFHCLDGAATPGGPLDRLCQYAPPGTRVVILSRTLPQLSYSWLTAFHGVTGVSAEDLRFDGDESAALLAAHGLPAMAAEALANRSEGWAAGLLLLARTGTSMLDVRDADAGPRSLEARTARRHAAFALLAAEQLAALPQALRTFALESAAVCPATCAQVGRLLERSDVRATFAALRQHGFFVAEDGEGVVRYHDLLAECLLAGHAAAMPARHRELRRRRATLLEQEGALEQAAALLRGDRDWEELVQLLYRRLGAFWTRGSYATIAACVEALPDAWCTADLMVRRGEAHRHLGQFAVGLAWADAALVAADDPVVVIRALLLRANVFNESGRYVEVPPITQRCAQLAVGVVDAALRARVIAVAADTEGFVLLKLGERQQGEAQLALAEAYYAGTGALWDQGRVITNRAIGLVEAGWGQEAIAQAERALPLLREIGDVARVAFCDYVRALAVELADGPAVAHAWLREAMGALLRAGKVCAACIALGQLARMLVDAGEAARGQELGEQALETARRLEDEDAWRAAQRALIAACIAQRHTSEARARIAVVRAESVPPPELAELDYLEGFRELRTGAFRTAAATLGRTARQLEELNRPHLAARSHLLHAEALLARGLARPAQAALNAAAALAAARQCEGYLLPLARYLPAMLGRCHVLRPNAAARSLLRKLAAAAGPATPEGGAATEHAIALQPFGEGTVQLDGTLVELRALDAKARELLFFLAEHGQPVQRMAVVEAMWPDEDGARGTRLLSDVLYRLRCALGDELLPHHERRLALRATVRHGGRALLALADEASTAHEAGDLPRVAAILARASGYLAGGPFLPWCTSAWAVEARERYAVAAGRLAALGGCGNADATDAPLAHRVM
jgi:ATP/maltotriose-dependent transcriptional regulator MalT